MSKTNKIKSDLEDVSALVEIIQILKDVASNHFYNTAKRKERFADFALAFTEFFKMVSLSEAVSPLVNPTVDTTGLLLITSEGGFMGEMTGKIVRAGVAEAKKFNVPEYIVIGQKGADKLKALGVKENQIKLFTNVEVRGLYRTVLIVKDYIIDQVLASRIGRIFTIYPRAKTINLIKPRIVKLLPSEELLAKQRDIKDVIEKVIVESDLNYVIHYLADLWLTCRLYEMLEDCVISGYAAQSQQLEAALERLKKDKKGLVMGFRKAKRADIDKSLREVFTSSLITGRR